MEHGKQELKIKTYHEAVNMAITDASSRPFGGEHTPRSCMLTSVARVSHKTRRKWWVNKETEGWMMEGSLELLPFVDDDDSEECSVEWLEPSEASTSFNSETTHRVSHSSSWSSPKRRRLSKGKQTTEVLKRATTDKGERWQDKEWYGRPKSRWQQPAGVTAVRVRTIRGTSFSHKEIGEKSSQKWTKWELLWKRWQMRGKKKV